MRVYVSVDMEGLGGVVALPQVFAGSSEYERYRKWMTEEVRAAIEGAIEFGAKKIVVADSHGSMTNLLIEELPEEIEVITGFPRPVCMVHGIWEGFDAALFLGYHARKGIRSGVMSHTIAGRIFSYIKINDVEASEFYLNALVAGFYETPVALIAGDVEICKEAKIRVPQIETVITKVGITRFSAKTKTLKRIKKELKEKTIKALHNVREGKIKPLKVEGEIRLELGFFDPDIPNLLEYLNKVELLDDRRIVYKAKDIIDAYKMIEIAMILGIGLQSIIEKK